MNIEFLNALIKDREESADTLEKPSMKGVKSSVIDKYTDQAHFIYELLQNADDTNATYVRFKLYHDKLVFAHNGKRHFSVSSPDSEEQDRENGRLGDVNAILSIGNSSKTSENTIGKFGVGFKAVFQYTSTPHIYDPEIRFKIERFIVPVLLESDFPDRKSEETLFVFPFDHKDNTPDKAFEAIKERLCSLVNPLLFLSYLQKIDFEFDDTKGSYQKEIIKNNYCGNTNAECIALSKVIDDSREEEKLWLLSRTDEKSRRYSVGFSLDENGKLCPVQQYAYCFFPTRETTGLNFIIHAPFLLTDSREGIKKGNEHNEKMIDLLATLAADSLVYLRDIGNREGIRLIDDNIMDIVPTSEKYLWGNTIKSESEFEPFYEKILTAFKSEKIIPTKKAYVIAENAYWADNRDLASVFDAEVLQALMNNPNAQWVFTTLPRRESQYEYYIDEIIDENCVDEDEIRRRININPDFIRNRSIEWLSEFYTWIDGTNNRVRNFCTLPIFLDSKGNAVPAYDREGKLVLFLPTEEDNDYITVNEKLLENEDTKAFLVNTIKITKPALKNEIYNKILPKFKEGDKFDSKVDFKKLFEYYMNECPPAEQDSYISELQKYKIVRYSTADDAGCYRGNPKEDCIYFPSEELKEYFKVKASTKFVELNDYIELVGGENEKFLCSFLIELGVSKGIQIIDKEMTRLEAEGRRKWSHSNGQDEWSEKVIDGCSENICSIVALKNRDKSVFFWNTIIALINRDNIDLNKELKGKHIYHWYRRYYEWFESINVSELRDSKWLFNKSDEFVSPSETYADVLADGYDTSSLAARQFISFLKMPFENPEFSGLSQEQRKDIELARRLKEIGVSTENMDEALAILAMLLQSNQSFGSLHELTDHEGCSAIPHEKIQSKVGMESRGRVASKPRNINDIIDADDVDFDEYIPKTIDYQKKIERAKSKRDAELDLIENMEELQQKAVGSQRYTYQWFQTLLELEMLSSSENHSNSREVSISFGKIEQESSTNRTLILKQPTCYIPRFMEELADIPLMLVFADETKKLPIEVMNIKSYTLRVKLKPNVDISNIDFSAVREAKITAQNPVFLLEELKKQFAKLNFNDDYDMQSSLCGNIDFIFGPPGTGKTTYLANEIIIPKMRQEEDAKILVLTPTNKAADVIVRKIQEVMQNDDSYLKWLVRFGGTDDEEIEKMEIYREKTFDIRQLNRSVTVTTIDRFPYDFFMTGGERHYIRNQKWDYIIFDEASMIPLVKIIYPLYLKTPIKFIIAGDPFQIEPVVALDMWKGENIYSMVKLESFSNPVTIPHKYDVKLLTMQYRSIPMIGKLFSNLAYDGILEHYRNNESIPCLNIENHIAIKPLNIIKFPVSKYESIYRSKRLGGTTPYQVYSALFTYEFTIWLSSLISKNITAEKFSIGVIAAYKAQADLIDRLISSAKIPDNISVQTGTIHGFQGDECEMIISVYNPPPSISDSKEMFLNKKNIINVSVSRARDYLFVIMPDDKTENVNNLFLIKRMEQYIKDSEMYLEYDSHFLEQMMFGDSNYLENNSFSTSHQSVNVYGFPEQKYEIRSEEDAIDIQIH